MINHQPCPGHAHPSSQRSTIICPRPDLHYRSSTSSVLEISQQSQLISGTSRQGGPEFSDKSAWAKWTNLFSGSGILLQKFLQENQPADYVEALP